MYLKDDFQKNTDVQEVLYVSKENEKDQELRPEKDTKKSDTLFLYFVVISVELLIVVCGAAAVWMSPVFKKLHSNDTEVNPIGRPITTEEVSLLSGIPGFAGIVGTLLLPKFSDFIGRKKYLQLMGLSLLLSGIAQAFSNQVNYIIISKCLTGLFITGAWCVVPLYVIEICEDHNRGKFGCFLGLFHQIGHLFGYIVGPIFNVRDFTLISFAPASFFLVFSFLIPESPFYLLSKGKEKECFKALKNLRSNKTEIELQKDFDKINETIKANTTAKKENVLSLFKKKQYRIALLLALLPSLVQHLSGVAVIMSFLAPIFDSAQTSLSGDHAAIIVSIVKTSTFTFTSLVVEKFGRRRMLLTSAIGTSIPLFSLGIYFYLQHIGSPFINHLQWLPMVGILSNVLIYSVGLGLIPMTLIGEFFPSELRAAASSVILTITSIVIIALMTSYPLISKAFGNHWCLWMFGSSCVTGSILIYLYLPKTEGKSLNEIQDILKHY